MRLWRACLQIISHPQHIQILTQPHKSHQFLRKGICRVCLWCADRQISLSNSVCLCLSLSLSLSVSLSPSLPLSLSFPPSLIISSLSLFLSHFLSLPLSLSLAPSFSLTLSLSLSFFLSHSLSFSLTLSRSLSLSFSLSPPLFLSPFLFPPLPLSFCLPHPLTGTLLLSLFPSLTHRHLYFANSTRISTYWHVPKTLQIYLHRSLQCSSAGTYIHVCTYMYTQIYVA